MDDDFLMAQIPIYHALLRQRPRSDAKKSNEWRNPREPEPTLRNRRRVLFVRIGDAGHGLLSPRMLGCGVPVFQCLDVRLNLQAVRGGRSQFEVVPESEHGIAGGTQALVEKAKSPEAFRAVRI